MKTQEKKQKTIELAWEKCIGYEKSMSLFKRGLINKEGFASDKYGLLFGKYFMNIDFEYMQTTMENGFVRPKSLSGIETNNGWTVINSEDDLPKEDCECFIYFKDGSCYCDRFLVNYKQFTKHHWRHITHYQIITNPLKPIY